MTDVGGKAVVATCMRTCILPQCAGPLSHIIKIVLHLAKKLFLEPVARKNVKPQIVADKGIGAKHVGISHLVVP